jgi:endogenous inhibitor of DNA gyrase (YacG/DUF329 family)
VQKKSKEIACPTCGAPVEWSDASPWRPFCSERCRLIDLGEWLDEKHRIADDGEDETVQPFLPPTE